MTFHHRLEIRAAREPWRHNGVSLWLFGIRTEGGRTVESVAEPVAFRDLTPQDAALHHEPVLTLEPGVAQQLMDELWHAGLRPTEGQGSVGQMAAVQAHLKDLQRLVFKEKKT